MSRASKPGVVFSVLETRKRGPAFGKHLSLESYGLNYEAYTQYINCPRSSSFAKTVGMFPRVFDASISPESTWSVRSTVSINFCTSCSIDLLAGDLFEVRVQ